MNIILDIDGTLIDENIGPRPYLDSFMLFCFRNFTTVSLWTAGTALYASNIVQNILQPILDAVSYKLQKHCSFYLVMTDIHCVFRNNVIIKPLQSLGGNFAAHNTLIVDDTPSTFTVNPFNGIPIPRFSSCNYNDAYLLMVQFYILELISGFKVFDNVTYLNRAAGYWYIDAYRIELTKNAVATYVPLTTPMDLGE